MVMVNLRVWLSGEGRTTLCGAGSKGLGHLQREGSARPVSLGQEPRGAQPAPWYRLDLKGYH